MSKETRGSQIREPDMHLSLLANTGAACMPSFQGVDFRESQEFPYCSMLPRPGDVEVEVEVNLRPTVRPVCLGVGLPSEAHDQIFVLSDDSRVSVCGTPSLTRGWVCNLLVQLLLGLARAVTLGSKYRRTHGHILLSHLRLPQLGGPSSRIYIPQEQGGPVIPPGTVFPFCRLLRLAGLR
jgi:hypothetical protein